MLKDLKQFEFLGSPTYFHRLFTQMRSTKDIWTLRELSEMFSNTMIDGRMNFRGGLAFALDIGFLVKDEDEGILIEEIVQKNLLSSEVLKRTLLEESIKRWCDSDEFTEIFSPENIKYDHIHTGIVLLNSAFKLIYANFKQFLIDFDFILPVQGANMYLVNEEYRYIFERYIISPERNKKLDIDNLMDILELKRQYGLEAEEYVLEYEKKRLADHRHLGHVQRISDIDVSAGYDIISYDDIHSVRMDRFIEVKSFNEVESFYWSRNELETSKRMKEEYFLYLVDRSKIHLDDYEPTIIKDPYNNILHNEEWNKLVESYFISR